MPQRFLARIEDVADFHTLWRCYRLVRRGKRSKAEVQAFERNLEFELTMLRRELLAGTYRPGPMRSFVVYEPKRRPIYCLPFRDRVVQYALYETVFKPAFGKTFLDDNMACQLGKGTHRGLDRLSVFFRECYHRHGLQAWILKADIHKYFESIDPVILKKVLRRYLKGGRVLALLDLFIDHGAEANGGVPIGNLTSQYFGLIYLDEMDHMVRDQWGLRWYVRYMDDFVLLHPSKEELKDILRNLESYLERERHLQLNSKTQIFPFRQGVDFLGFHTYCLSGGRVIRKLRRKSKDNMRRRIKRLMALYWTGQVDGAKIKQHIAGWLGHAKHGNIYALRKRILSRAVFRKSERRNCNENQDIG